MDEDLLHAIAKGKLRERSRNTFPWRGLMNITVQLLVLGLFAFSSYLVFQLYHKRHRRNSLIDGRTGISPYPDA
jgi:hypothetical protein